MNTNTNKTRFFNIVGSARVEGTQRGYVVSVRTSCGRSIRVGEYADHGTFAGITAAYASAAGCAASIKRGILVTRIEDHQIAIKGRRLAVRRVA